MSGARGLVFAIVHSATDEEVDREITQGPLGFLPRHVLDIGTLHGRDGKQKPMSESRSPVLLGVRQ